MMGSFMWVALRPRRAKVRLVPKQLNMRCTTPALGKEGWMANPPIPGRHGSFPKSITFSGVWLKYVDRWKNVKIRDPRLPQSMSRKEREVWIGRETYP